jgi:glycosyltransferase involved in cell wall biosynthesis
VSAIVAGPERMSTSSVHTDPAVAVVVATRDRPELLADVLESLAEVLRPQDEAVVVDSASSTDGPRRVAEAAGFRVVRCDLPGVARARNAGVAATTAPIIAMTDDDCLATPGWLDAVEAAFTTLDVGFVTGRVVPDRRTGEVLSVLEDEEPKQFERGDDPAAIGHGANMAWRRVAFEAIGGFDEVLGPGARLRYAEEHDAFWRCLRRGWIGRFEPASVLTHRQWRGRTEFLRIKYGYGFGSGAFAAKVARVDGPEGRRLLLDTVWRNGVAQGFRALREGYEAGAAGCAAKAVGAVIGAAAGIATPVADGHYVR